MTIAMYPGRFDPVTNGHVDIMVRASRIYERVVVSVVHSNSTLFTTEERVQLARDAVAEVGLKNVEVTSHTGLTVEAAKQHGATVLVRGLRAITDFTTEFDMALMNRNMAPEIESAFLMTAVEYLYISASRMRELASLGRDVSEFVPPGVNEALLRKFAAGAG